MTLLSGRRITMFLESVLRALPASGALRLSRFGRSGILSPKFTVDATNGDICHVTARGDQAWITQALLDAIRSLSSPLGVVFVVVEESSTEWIASPVRRQKVLEGLVTIRDLLGTGGVDLAVFSSTEGIEIFLDRSGTLEFRYEPWWEPRLRSILGEQGFRLVPRLPTPSQSSEETIWSPEESARLDFVRSSFGMKQVNKKRASR